MRREYLRAMAMRGLILGLWCATAGIFAAATPPATLKAVDVHKPAAGEELILSIDGDYSFKAFQASQDAVTIDLMGVEAGKVAPEGEWSGGAIKGYSLLQYANAAHLPVTHLRISLTRHEPFQTQQAADGLHLLFGEDATASQPMPTARTAEPAISTAASSVAEIKKVSVADGADGQTIVHVTTAGRAEYRVFKLDNPARLVLDFEGVRSAARLKTYRTQSNLLSEVRVAQFRAKNPSVVRLVADLEGNPNYDVQRVPDGVQIVLKAKAAEAQPAPAPVSADAVQTAKTAHPFPVAPASSQPATLKVSEVKTAETSTESSPLDSALPENSRSANASPNPEALKEAPPKETANKAAQVVAPNSLDLYGSPGQSPAAAPAAENQTPQYTGEPISLNLKDVDLKDFFRLIHEISGLNIIIDPDVTGTVTMVLDNVPWDQALDIVLRNNHLGKTLEGNVLRIAKISTLTAEQADQTKLVEAREEAQPLVTKFVPVNYAKASQIATMLKSWVGGGALSKRGNILVDDRTNTLIVSDIASQIPIILPIIAKLDTKTKQVAIEARIERVTSDFERTLANSLAIGHINKSGSTTMAGLSGIGSKATTDTLAPFTTTVTQPSATGFGVYTITNIGARYLIEDVIAAAETTDHAKTISKPTIVTQNNVPGKVTQGVQIPIQTNINNTITVTYVQASLILTVTPQVTSDGNIFLVIDVQNSSPGAVFFGAAGPSINTQQATTQVLVPDGGTVIFGGVTVNEVTSNASYVPILGKIPILGNLFKNTDKTTNDQELLFFVTPRILPG